MPLRLRNVILVTKIIFGYYFKCLRNIIFCTVTNFKTNSQNGCLENNFPKYFLGKSSNLAKLAS